MRPAGGLFDMPALAVISAALNCIIDYFSAILKH